MPDEYGDRAVRLAARAWARLARSDELIRSGRRLLDDAARRAWPDPCGGAARPDPAPRGPRVRTEPDDLVAWIAALRARLACGELAGHGPVDVVGGALLPAELAARLMVADLGHHRDLPPGRRRDLLVVARRRLLLRDLRRLRAPIG